MPLVLLTLSLLACGGDGAPGATRCVNPCNDAAAEGDPGDAGLNAVEDAGLADAAPDNPAGDAGSAPVRETPLGEGCKLLSTPPQWLAADFSRVLGTCNRTLSSLALDGAAPIPLAELSGTPITTPLHWAGGSQEPLNITSTAQVSVLSADLARVVYLEASLLRSVASSGAEPVVTLANEVKSARVSSDGTRVVYVAAQAGTGTLGLFSVSSGGGDKVLLSAGFYGSSSYGIGLDTGGYHLSEDGAWVWFVGQCTDGAAAARKLCIVPTAGGQALEVDAEAPATFDDTATWSRDGYKLVYEKLLQAGEGTSYLAARVAAHDGGLVDLPYPAGVSQNALQLSQNADFVWLRGREQLKPCLKAAAADGGAWSDLAGAPESLSVLGEVGQAGGRLLYVAGYGAASPVLREVPLQGGEPVELATLSSQCDLVTLPALATSISTDHTRMPVVDATGALLLADLDAATSTTVLADAVELTKADLCRSSALLSPDHTRIAFYTCRFDDCGTAVVDLAGTRLLSNRNTNSFSFSPDSQLLENHNLYGVSVFAIGDDELSYKFSDTSSGNLRDQLWIDTRRLVVPLSRQRADMIVTFR